MRSVALVLALVTGVLIGLLGPGAVTPRPVCEEDEVLVGTGQFEHGSWTRYQCGPAVDDLVTWR